MSRLLVVYGTTDGQTARIADFLGAEFRALGVPTDVVRAGADAPGPGGYDGVVVAASVHVGGFQRPVMRWVRAHATELQRRRTAFLVVCLGVLERNPATDAELRRLAERVTVRTGWVPGETQFVAGALHWSRYGLFRTWALRRIVGKAGGNTDTSRDVEYTDWKELRRFAGHFAARSGVYVSPMGVVEAGHAGAAPAAGGA